MADNDNADAGLGLLEKNETASEAPVHSRRAVFRSSSVLQTLLWVLQSLRPSFLSASTRTGRLRRTAYLDGIRGFAAFLVYWHHHILWSHEGLHGEVVLQSGFGWNGEYYLVTAPFIRVFVIGGHVSVAIFFVLSGYVLSAKAISLIDQGELVQLGDSLASAVFRRWFRLWIPVIVTTFGLVSFYYMTGIWANFIPQGSYRQELVAWYKEIKNYTFIFGRPAVPWLSYNPHTWTIRTELCGSVIVYLTITALSRATRRARLWCELGLIFYFMYIVDGAHYSMFLTGLLLCDLDMAAAAGELPRWMVALEPYQTIIWYSMFIAGLYLGGVPSSTGDFHYLQDNPGWNTLSWFKPSAVYDFKWFYLYFAALFIISAIPHLGWAKRFFETRFCLYLGRVSYMLYLFHGPVLWTLGDRLYASVGWSRESHALHLQGWTNRFPVPKWGPFGLELSFFVPNLILFPLTLWLAEIGTSMIDGPAIKFGTWLYSKTRPSASHTSLTA